MVFVASFRRLRASMAGFSVERPRHWPFVRWELSVIVGTQGSDGKVVKRGGCEKELEP